MADRINWSPEETIIFVDLCLEQVRLGKRGSGHLLPATFREVGVKFEEIRGKKLTPKQLRNKWDSLRAQWIKWNWLKRYANTGVGWNEVVQTYEASDEWWRAADEEYKRSHSGSILCFRTRGLQYKENLDEMFSGTKGTNDKLWAPSSSAPPPQDSPEGSGDSEGDPQYVDPQDNLPSVADDSNEDSFFRTSTHAEESSAKRKTFGSNGRKRAGKKRYSREDITNDLGELIASMKARSSNNSMSVCSGDDPRSMKAVMEEVWTLPAIVQNIQMGLDAADVLMDPDKRVVFVSCPTPEIKTQFLLREIDKMKGAKP